MKKSKLFVISVALIMVCVMLVACVPQAEEVESEAPAATDAVVEAEEPADTEEPAETSGGYTMGFCPMDLSNPFFAEMAAGVQDYCDKNGITVTIVDGKSDAQAQVTAVENFMSQGVDAIALVPVDAESLDTVVNEAVAAGIPVVTHTTFIEGATGYIGVKESDMGITIGRVAGQWLAENHPGEAVEYAILNQPTLPQIIEREQGIQKGIEEFAPEAKLVTTVAAWLPDMGMEAAENIMQAFPNVKMIVGINDSGALGAYETIKGMSGVAEDGDFFIGGVDGSQTAVELIAKGDIYRGSVNIKPFETGHNLLQFLVDSLQGKEVVKETWVEVTPIDISNAQEVLDAMS